MTRRIDARNIYMRCIDTPYRNNRKEFIPESIVELAASYGESGPKIPIILRCVGNSDRFEIVAGERRWRAAKIAGLETIPSIVHHGLSDSDAQEIGLIENLCREDLNPMDKSFALVKYKEAHPDITDVEHAKRLGINRTRFAQCIKLSSLPKDIHSYFYVPTAGKKGTPLSQKHGEILLTLMKDGAIDEANHKILSKVAEEAYHKPLTCTQLKSFIKKLLSGEQEAPELDGEYTVVEKNLRDYLGKTVEVKKTKTGGGTVKINYDNLHDLLSLQDKIMVQTAQQN